MGHVDALSPDHTTETTEEIAAHVYSAVPRCSTPYQAAHRSCRVSELDGIAEGTEENIVKNAAGDVRVTNTEEARRNGK